MKNKQHNLAIDFLRVLAILAVVMIHTTTKTLEVSGYVVQQTPWTLFLNQASRFAVPLFFLISGFVLELNYKQKISYALYFQKRASKIIIPYIFWSIFYIVLVFHSPITFSFFWTLINGNASYQLYFIPTVIIFYLLFPIFHTFYKFVLSFILLSNLYLLSYDYYRQTLPIATPLRVAALSFGIFILGMVASHYQEQIMKFTQKYFFFLLAAFFILMFGVYKESEIYFLTTRNIGAIYSQYRPMIYIFTIVLACILYYLYSKYPFGGKYIILMSQLSFFVFFVHVEILYVYWYTIGVHVLSNTNYAIAETLWYDPAVFLGVSAVSFILAAIVHKIPKAQIITG